MSTPTPLEHAIARAVEQQRTHHHGAPRFLMDTEVVLDRDDLRLLLEAAQWRAGYLEGKGDR